MSPESRRTLCPSTREARFGVDPVERILEAFALYEGQWRLIATVEDNDPVSIAPFEAITFSLGELWD